MHPIIVRLSAAAAVVILPLPAVAASSAYAPPKLAKPGSSSASVAGSGDVTVQIFVKKDGSFGSSRVIRSTNPLDNTAALEIAKTATYTPATRGGKTVDAYYDYVLKFTGAGVASTSTGTTSGAGPTASAYAAIRAGKYADAKAQLQAYLQSHPGDVQANTLLGVADGFAGDDDGAAAAFDSVPSIPQQYQTLAAQAYAKHTQNLVTAGKNKDAQQSATRTLGLNPNSVDAYFLRGVATMNESQFAAALPDLQKAYDLAKTAKADNKSLATIGFSLAVAQFNTGAFSAGAATAKDVVRLDPAQQTKLDAAETVAVANEAIAAANAGNVNDAVAKFDSGAALLPASAGALYGRAAYILLTQKPMDNKRVKAEADKSLAADPGNGMAHFAEAFVAANTGDQKATLEELNKAKSSALYTSDPSFAKQVDDNLKKLTTSSK